MNSKNIRRSITAEVEIDASDLDSGQLVELLEGLGYTVIMPDDADSAQAAYYHLNDSVPEPIRSFVVQAAGRVC